MMTSLAWLEPRLPSRHLGSELALALRIAGFKDHTEMKIKLQLARCLG